MTRSAIFAAAHRITRSTVKAGDDYRTTFGLVLKAMYADKGYMAEAVIAHVGRGFVVSVRRWTKGNQDRIYVQHTIPGQAASRRGEGCLDLVTGTMTWSAHVNGNAWERRARIDAALAA